jgi:hypothetical protein
MADRLGVEALDREDRVVVIRFRAKARVDPVRLINIVREWPGAILVPPATLKLDLLAADKAPGAGGPSASKGPGTRQPRQGRLAPVRPGGGSTSWWTARATTGEVRAGFTREEILKRPDADPRGEGGTFARVESLLRALGT